MVAGRRSLLANGAGGARNENEEKSQQRKGKYKIRHVVGADEDSEAIRLKEAAADRGRRSMRRRSNISITRRTRRKKNNDKTLCGLSDGRH